MKNKYIRILIALSSILLYAAAVLFAHPIIGNIVGVFLIIPVITISYLYGPLPGTLGGVFFAVTNLNFLYFTEGSDYDQLFVQSIVGGLAIVVVGYMVGYTKKTSEENSEIQKRLSVLHLGLEKTKDIIFTTDSDGYFEYVNPAFMKVYGYSATELRDKTPRILKSGYRDDKFYKNFWSKIKSGQAIQVYMRNKTKNGKTIDLDASVNPILNKEGGVIGFLAIQRDVTEKMQTEADLMKKTAELEKMNSLMVGRELKMIELKKS